MQFAIVAGLLSLVALVSAAEVAVPIYLYSDTKCTLNKMNGSGTAILSNSTKCFECIDGAKPNPKVPYNFKSIRLPYPPYENGTGFWLSAYSSDDCFSPNRRSSIYIASAFMASCFDVTEGGKYGPSHSLRVERHKFQPVVN